MLPALAACALLAAQTDPASDKPSRWWLDAVFYEVFVRSFADSTEGPLASDGVGDLRGLAARLDLLNDNDPTTTHDLGVTALWLMPVAQSPSYHGYDVVDYGRVDDEYGTREDFLALIDAAHARGMRVIVDMVINHTSSAHPWFVESIDPGSARHAWYRWEASPARDERWSSPVWHDRWRARNGKHAFGLFWEHMPDLNLDSPEAARAITNASIAWLTDFRADGLRIDAAKHLIERGAAVENTPETIAWLERYRGAIRDAAPDAFVVGEVWSPSAEIAPYLRGGLDSAFCFDLAEGILASVRGREGASLRAALARALQADPEGRMAVFLSNHDQTRAMTRLDHDPLGARLAAEIMLTLPGVPFLYYGEELGVAGDKPDPDLRLPMPWTEGPEPDGGIEPFSRARAWREGDSRARPWASQTGDETSLLSAYRLAIRRRLESPALRRGSCQLLRPADPALVAFLREHPEERVLVVINLGDEAVEGDASWAVRGPFEPRSVNVLPLP